MIVLIVLFLLNMQVVDIPTPDSYAALVAGAAWTAVSGFLIWSLNRNVKNADEEIDALKEIIKETERKKEVDRAETITAINKINDNIDRLKESTNDKISSLALRISEDLRNLAIKVASIDNSNDRPSK